MVRRSQVQWRELFQEQEASGLDAVAFCQMRGVCPKYFSLRRRQLLAGAVPAVSAFVPVAVPRSVDAQTLEVRWGATLSLRVPVAVSPRWLVEVLHGLRG